MKLFFLIPLILFAGSILDTATLAAQFTPGHFITDGTNWYAY